MAFTDAWAENDPAGSDAANIIDDASLRNMRRLRERLATIFPDWTTATDRIHQEKLFLNSNGLTGRDDGDTTTLFSVNSSGFWSFTKQPMCFVYKAYDGLTTANQGELTFNTEIIDTQTMHDNAVNPARITIPANGGGIYKVWFNCLFGNTNAGIRIDVLLKKNGAVLGEPYKTRNVINTAVTSEATVDTPTSAVWYVSLAAADYITLRVDTSDASAWYNSNASFGALKLT